MRKRVELKQVLLKDKIKPYQQLSSEVYFSILIKFKKIFYVENIRTELLEKLGDSN